MRTMVKLGAGDQTGMGERQWQAWEWFANDEGDDEAAEAPSLWEAEITALSDEQLMALEDVKEDD
jgi:hypothetical protein